LECGPLAFRVARGVMRNTADAEDVAQEALLRVYRRFDRLRDRAGFRSWLVRFTFRLALDRCKSRKRREQRETLWARPEGKSAPPNAAQEDKTQPLRDGSQPPFVCQFKASVNMILKDGQTSESVVSTDPLNGHSLRISVTINLIK
jgi:RNA polymerase sigma factor (sigma-70 family)